MRKILIYHHSDQDGYLAAAIAHYFLSKEKLNVIKFESGDYAMSDVKFDALRWADKVYILDYSLPNKVMEQFFDKIVWIDHHKTAMQEKGVIEAQLGKQFDGIRQIGKAGCLLTWEWFTDEEAPLVLKLVNDRDVWNWKFGTDTAAFHEASKVFLRDISEWTSMLTDDAITERYLREGEKILQYIEVLIKEQIETFAFEGELAGHKTAFLNMSTHLFGETSRQLRAAYPQYEFVVMFIVSNRGVRVSLYRQDGLTAPDMSEIAEQFGGGGHEGAAGFYISAEKWSSIIDNSR